MPLNQKLQNEYQQKIDSKKETDEKAEKEAEGETKEGEEECGLEPIDYTLYDVSNLMLLIMRCLMVFLFSWSKHLNVKIKVMNYSRRFRKAKEQQMIR